MQQACATARAITPRLLLTVLEKSFSYAGYLIESIARTGKWNLCPIYARPLKDAELDSCSPRENHHGSTRYVHVTFRPRSNVP